MQLTLLTFAIIIYNLKTVTLTGLKLRDAIDLSWPFDNNTVYWGDGQPFVFTKQKAGVRDDGIWYSVNEFCTAEHGGTHFDAPYHFKEDGWKVGDVPLSRLIANGITIDLRDEVKQLNDETLLLPKHLESWEKIYGAIPENSVILVNFGWSQYYPNKERYMGIDKQGVLHFPGISIAAAEWIARSGKVVGIGLDTPSVDPGISTNFTVHKLLSDEQIYNLENVNIPAELPAKDFVLFVMPMKIAEGTGAPVRLVAVPTTP